MSVYANKSSDLQLLVTIETEGIQLSVTFTNSHARLPLMCVV